MRKLIGNTLLAWGLLPVRASFVAEAESTYPTKKTPEQHGKMKEERVDHRADRIERRAVRHIK